MNEPAVKITFVVCFLCSVFVAKGQTQDSIRTVILHEVTVKANKKLYKTKPDAIIYDVSSDSTLVGKNSFEALRNAPLLNVSRNGSVHSVGNWPVEYLVNGAHDSFLSGNLQDALETLDSKYLKSIESRIVRGVDGEEKLQVNIVTKGRILGYRGLFNTGIYDDKWKNGGSSCFPKEIVGVFQLPTTIHGFGDMNQPANQRNGNTGVQTTTILIVNHRIQDTRRI